MSEESVSLSFLADGGEMGALMRAHNWSCSSLGPPSSWPQALRTVVRLMLNTGHPMYIWWGADGACLYNDAYRQSIGPERHPSSLGRPARAVWDEIWPIIGPQIEQVMSGGGATWHEDALVPITRHGRREDVYWTYSYSPIDDDTAPNGIGGVLVTCAETTKQIIAARQLSAERDRFAELFEQAPTFMVMLSGPEHRFELMNPGYQQLVGNRPVLGKTVLEAIPEAAEQGFMALLDQVYQSGEAYTGRGVRFAIAPAGGGPVRERILDFVYQPIKDAAGQVTGIFVDGVDVTDRAKAEAALRELNADLERQVAERSLDRGRTWDLSPDLIGVLNDKAIFESSNPAWQTTLGWTKDEVARTPFFDFLHPDDVARNHVAFDGALNGQPAIRFENRYRHKDGTYRWLSWVAIPEGGKIYCSARDITAEKDAADELARAQEALRQSQKMEAVGQLTGGIAHDFNNLLAGISGSLELIDKRMGQGRLADTQRFIGIAQDASRRAAALTQRLLAFSRRQTLDPRPVDMNRLIAGMEDLIQRTIGPDVQLEVSGTDGLWSTRVDPSQLENALLNLCINARDAMAPNGGRLTIEAANTELEGRAADAVELPPGDYVSMRVGDTGAGMEPATIARAFDPFFTTKPLGKGTGLGLSMVYGFVRQSGGQVRIHSQVGKGTVVHLYLPRHAGAAEGADAIETAASPQGATGETVLVIDDESSVRLLIADVLQEAGYAAIQAHDGPTGLAILQSAGPIDLLITDVGLPGGMNGRQVADAARTTRPDLKVLFITGYAEKAALSNDRLAPGMEIMTKPFHIAALAGKIREMLEG